MRNYFIIHGSFGDSNEHWIPWLKKSIRGTVYTPDFPIGLNEQTFDSWSKKLDEYKKYINKDTVFIGRSIAPIFIVKYLLENKLQIDTLISISGFNGFINIPDYDFVNKSFFLNEMMGVKNIIKNRICIYSKNDPYVPYYLLDMFSKNLGAKRKVIKEGGHFNADSGYGQTFPELLDVLNSLNQNKI